MSYPPATAEDRPAAGLNRSRASQPARWPGSLRRSVSFQTSWPEGLEAHVRMIGRARDLFTSETDGACRELGSDWITARLQADLRIAELDASRRQDILARFAGLRPGGEMRKAMAAPLADEALAETCLHRLLDDLAGAAFMSAAAWYAWPNGLDDFYAASGAADLMGRPVTGLCLSYVPGSPAIRPDGTGNEDIAHHPLSPTPLGGLGPDDFHELAEISGPNQWRLRRTDLWREGSTLHVDAWFQDSSSLPDELDRRLVFHEYSVAARFDSATFDLIAIDVTPHVLPYTTCRASPPTAHVLEGLNARELRSGVPLLLRGTAGCTHLNDMLRSLQDVHALGTSLARVGSVA